VFYEKSHRNITVEAARAITEGLPERVEKVGVFVDAECSRIHEIVASVGLTAVQLHGKLSLESVCEDARSPLECTGASKLITVITGDALHNGGILISERLRSRTFALLVDSTANGSSGGTGITFDWQAVRGMVQALSLRMPVVVAGGLTPQNVGEAIRTFQPFGVDVVSGVEAKPGKKDLEKVRTFIREVRDLDRKTT
jgi:phosphoribosylanthranilate isomerase